MRIVLVAVILAALSACDNQRASQPPTPKDVKASCQSKKDQLILKSDELLALGKAREALPLIGECLQEITDPTYRQAYDRARAAVAKLDYEDIPPDQTIARHGALQLWKTYAGSLPAEQEKELKRMNEEDARRLKQQRETDAQVAKMDFWGVCLEAGRIVRGTEAVQKQPRSQAILRTAGISGSESAVRMRSVELGMNECALAASLGRPDHINRSVGSYGTHDQWVYRNGRYDYIYTENGKVRSYQQ